ncbi:MAG TPA: hypothetical protein PK668_17395 [Myxococcota bacterium]|nr:hypothetical protein [Myxococcota bacterium]HRY94936.1 hypothetical protein [Myxococcota bacterium]
MSQAVERLLPDLDLFELGLVKAMHVTWDGQDRASSKMELEVICERKGTKYLLTVVFRSIRNAILPDLVPTFMLDELFVEVLSRSNREGIRFRFNTEGMSRFEVSCESVEFTDCVVLGG